MKKNLLLILTFAAAQAAGAQTSRPARGFFNWKKLEGAYRFGDCSSRPGAIWSDRPESTHLTLIVYSDYTVNPPNESLEAARMNDGTTVVAPGWSIEHINQGPQERRSNETGEVFSAHESYTTADGVFGRLEWDQPHNRGWSTFQIFVDAQGGVRYEMHRQFHPDPEYVENCRLIRWEQREPARPGQPI